MKKQQTKILVLLCAMVCFIATMKIIPVKAYNDEVDYTFKTQSGVSIEQEVLQITDGENYYFKEYVDDSDYKVGKIHTYQLYEKDTNKPCKIGGAGQTLLLFDNNVYLIRNGVCAVNQFYYVGVGDDDSEYWCYFGADGKMVKNTVIYTTFKIDKKGFFNYRKSYLFKRILAQYKKQEAEYARSIYDSAEIRKKYTQKGYSKKQTDDMINKKIESYVNTSVNSYEVNVKDVTKILNKEKTSNLGKWVKLEDYVEKKSEYTADGEFQIDKNGQIRYWANSLLKNRELIPGPILMYKKFLDGYTYQPDDAYDWGTEKIAEDTYLTDMLVQLDGDYYHFNKKGYADRNKWVLLDTDNYFDDAGKRVTNDWVAKDGQLYHVDEYGSIEKNCWVDDENGKTYLSYDGTIYYAAKEKEYEVYNKIREFARRPNAGTEVGICSKYADTLVKYLFGKNAKGTKYSYDWDKIKVGDTISGDNHIFVVLTKGSDTITAAESNWGNDKAEHYGRVALDKITLDKLKKNGKMKYTFTTYYSAFQKKASDFKPQKAKFSAAVNKHAVTLKLNQSQGAVGYCVYMSDSEKGEYKNIKTIEAENELKYTVKDLAAGTYYFKVRAYRVINKKKVWGSYSSVVTCKVSD